MKYTRHFFKRLAENLNIKDSELLLKVKETENEVRKKLPDNFDYLELISKTCEYYSITVDEYFSKYRYGKLGKARQSVCFIMKLLGAKTIQISKMTGFSSAHISNSIKLISGDGESLKIIQLIINELNFNEE